MQGNIPSIDLTEIKNKISETDTQISQTNTAISNYWNTVYPIGSIYMSVNSTSPAELFGGTWARLKDRFLLGVGDTYTDGDTGGSATHTLTAAQLPKVTGTILSTFDGGTAGGFNSATGVFSVSGSKKSASVTNGSNTRYSTVTMSFGSGSSHNNMPPYLVVNMWKRTA